MLNKICFWLLCIGILYAFGKSAYQSVDRYYRGPSEPVQSPANSAKAAKSPASKTADQGKGDATEPGMTAMGKRLNDAVFSAAMTTIDICIKLIGTMAL